MHLRHVVLLAFFTLAACKGPEPVPDDSTTKTPDGAAEQASSDATESPKRIILFIGDGMGVGAVTAASYAKGGPLEMMSMPHVAWMRNHEYEYITTDSAASATAFATGHKTHFQGVAVKPGTTVETEADPANHLGSVLKAAEANGMKTGLVATSRINHATPAAFVANRHYRKQYDEIALDMSKTGVDVLVGGGSDFFDKRDDGLNLFETFEADGYTVARTAEEVRAASQSADKMVGLMHPKDMPYASTGKRAMSLAEMTSRAIEVLDRNNDKGWFLMVEGSFIDWCEHDLAPSCTVSETLDFDEAVKAGLDYARARKDTLVIATADHETGGVAVLDPRYVTRMSKSFGDEEAVAAASAPPKLDPPMEVERLPGQFPVGSGNATPAWEPVEGGEPVFGLDSLADRRYSITFGHLSVQSRTMVKPGEQRDFFGAHTTTHVPLFAEGPAANYVVEGRDNATLGQHLIELVGKSAVKAKPPQPKSKPKNVIVMIGDGMGINAITAAYYANGGLFMTEAPVSGIVSTHAADRVVNDSAASATAISTGRRSLGGAVGMAAEGGSLVSAETILERAERRGQRTGLVTTTQLAHATPASFYAHTEKRGSTDEIAKQFINMPERIEGSDGVDFVVAGGLEDFGAEQQKALSDAGYEVRTEWSDEVPKSRSVSILAPKGLPNARIRHRDGSDATPTLATMTQVALDSLVAQSGEEGFFLMVEGGQIDWLLHSMVTDSTLVDEIVDFDQAVELVVKWAEQRGDTLVVVTADHDHTLSVLDNHYSFNEPQNCRAAKSCGGTHEYPAIDVRVDGIAHGEGLNARELQGDYTPPKLHLQYGWIVQEANAQKKVSGPHSANFVPLFAWGPGAAAFGGYLDQPDVGVRLFEVGGYSE